MTGPLLASVIAAELEQWANTGYYPPRAVMCAAEHPISGALCRRIDCLGDHDHDGLPPWTEEETVTDAQLETRHYIGVTPMGRIHMTLGPDELSKFTTPPHDPLTLENGSVLFLVSAEVAEEWDMDDEDDA